MKPRPCVVRVAVYTPLRKQFDYLLPDKYQNLPLGMRVSIPFGKRKLIGLSIATTMRSTVQKQKLKYLDDVLDDKPIFNTRHLQLLLWASEYYHYPVGKVVLGCLPKLLRQQKKNLIESDIYLKDNHLSKIECDNSPTLTDSQQNACQRVLAQLNQYQTFLLEGVTGSGKTEVYIKIIHAVIAQNKQALLLLPEINLTPQFITYFQKRLQHKVAVLHSGLTDKQRLASWLASKEGEAKIIMGTRSSIWTPISNVGVYIVDEEHDLAYKQQEQFRYCARDIALIRGKQDNVPVILGSATPALESLQHVYTGKYQHLTLPERVGSAKMPHTVVLDIKNVPMFGAISQPLLEMLKHNLKHKEQSLLFLNRRGYANVLLCHCCSWHAICTHCDRPLIFHKQTCTLDCHHCGRQLATPKKCLECGHQPLLNIGHGTERIEEELKNLLPSAKLLRIDQDTTRRKGATEHLFTKIYNNEVDIVIGTQMLTKGHHFPKVTLVGIIDIDRGFYSSDFRASERMAQQIIQVGGRAGRLSENSKVVLQTHFAEHPLLQILIQKNYHSVAKLLLTERQAANLPPFSYLTLLRAEATQKNHVEGFMHAAKNVLLGYDNIQFFGPFPAPMPRRAGRYRTQLLLQSTNRNTLKKITKMWVLDLESLPNTRKVHWSIDVDPQEMF